MDDGKLHSHYWFITTWDYILQTRTLLNTCISWAKKKSYPDMSISFSDMQRILTDHTKIARIANRESTSDQPPRGMPWNFFMKTTTINNRGTYRSLSERGYRLDGRVRRQWIRRTRYRNSRRLKILSARIDPHHPGLYSPHRVLVTFWHPSPTQHQSPAGVTVFLCLPRTRTPL